MKGSGRLHRLREIGGVLHVTYHFAGISNRTCVFAVWLVVTHFKGASSRV